MKRAAPFILAAALCCSAGAAAAQAGASADGPRTMRVAGVIVTPQRGTVVVEKHKTKQRAARRLAVTDKTGPKHTARANRDDRPRIKQASRNMPIAIGDKSVSKHLYRSSRADRQKLKQAATNAAPRVRAGASGPKHQSPLAALDRRKLRHGTKESHSRATKTRAGEKQTIRHGSPGKA